MKIEVLLIALALISVLAWQCKPTKITMEKLPETYLKWGSTGGFTGKEQSFLLLENGHIYKFNGTDNGLEKKKSIKNRTASALFDAAGLVIDNKAAERMEPTNYYQFLTIHLDGKPYEITDMAKQKGQVKDLFNVLQQLVAEEGQ